MSIFGGTINGIGMGYMGFGKPTEPAPAEPPTGDQEPQNGIVPLPIDPWALIGYGLGGLSGYGNRPPGTYANYISALTDPVLAMARAYALNPIRTAKWSVGKRADGDQRCADFLKDKLLGLRDQYVDDALWAVDLGNQQWQVVWEIIDGDYVPVKLQPLDQILCTILIDDNGDYAGVKWAGVELLGSKALIYTYDRKGKYHYGRSRIENVIEAIWNWRDANDTTAKLGRKASGITTKVGYPPGMGRDSQGNPVSRKAQADSFGKTVSSGAGYITYPTLGGLSDDQLKNMRPEDIQKLLAASLWQIDTMNLGSNGPEMQAVTADKQYLDALKCLGYFVPPRAILEGHHGTMAEAGGHADAGTIANEPVNQGIANAFNKQVADPALVLKFGENARGAAWFEAEPLEDAQAKFDQQLILGAMQQQALGERLFSIYDFDAVMERNGVVRRPEPLILDTPQPPQNNAQQPGQQKPVDGEGEPSGKPTIEAGKNGNGKKPTKLSRVNGENGDSYPTATLIGRSRINRFPNEL